VGIRKRPEERNLRVPGQQKGHFAVLQNDKSMDDEATEAEITALENECHDVLFSAKSDLFDWSSRAHLENRPAVWAEQQSRTPTNFWMSNHRSTAKTLGHHYRGALKDIVAELGGGELYLHAERNVFRSDRYHQCARVYWDSGKMIPDMQFIAGLDSNII
jgi:hypothetical protein